jgi:predicted DNA-binding transcriptional regulator YafY
MRLEKTTAVLKLARALASNWEGLTLDEMADFIGVGRRTAERMRDAVEDVFGPLDHIDDDRKKRFRLAARGLDRFVTTPTIDELTELENAARALEAAQAPDRAAHLHSLRDKIGATLRDADRRVLSRNVEDQIRAETFACQVGPRPMADSSVLSALRQALLDQRVVRFNYSGADGGPPRWRKVVPYGLLFGPRYYLVASVKSRPGAVLFRLDMIHDVKVTEEIGAPLADFDLKTYAERSFGVFQEEPKDVELSFASPAARDARAYVFHPTQSFTDESDGSLTVRFRACGLLQIAHHLMTWGPAVTIVAPSELQDMMCEQVEALHAHHVASHSSTGSKRRPSTRNSRKSSSRKVPTTSVKGS